MDIDNKNVVVVAMSGGVDSSVAAQILKNQGVPIVGVSMQVWDYRNNGGSCSKATCCSPDDFTDARKVAFKLGVPYYVVDFEKTFRAEVIDKFVSTYLNAQTPNPCVDCNQKVKFKELRGRARSFGCGAVATGHYARIEQDQAGYHLLRGVDPDKDQSYFLYGLTQEELSETLFPVGHMYKHEVREIAKKAGLVTAEKPESQDICFVSGKVQDFLVQLGAKRKQGDIVLKDGSVVGKHDGVYSFTVGQRRGLGVGGNNEPYYVLELRLAENQVVVGPKIELERGDFLVDELSWVAPSFTDLPPPRFQCFAQLRSRHGGVKVEVELINKTQAKVSFLNDSATVTPGQVAAFYDPVNNIEVLGGGRIKV